jgi:hypothetical protein
MKKMKTAFAFIAMTLMLINLVSAQDVKLDYDETGNRTQRYKVLKSSEVTFADTALINQPIVEDVMISGKKTNVFPNPVGNHLNIIFSGEQTESGTVNVHLYDVKGNQLYSSTTTQNLHQIPMQDYPAGFYFLRISDSDKTEQWKIIKK